MGEDKGVKKNTAIAIVAVFIALSVALTAVSAYEIQLATQLSEQVSNQENTITNLQTTINQKDSEINNLQTEISQQSQRIENDADQINNLNNQIKDLETQIAQKEGQTQYNSQQVNELNSQIAQLKAAKLVNVGIGAYDNRNNESQPFIELTGAVFNVGRDTAYNCKLKIIANQGQKQSIFYVTLCAGTMEGLSSTTLSTNIYYTGGPIAMYNLIITPEWTNTP